MVFVFSALGYSGRSTALAQQCIPMKLGTKSPLDLHSRRRHAIIVRDQKGCLALVVGKARRG